MLGKMLTNFEGKRIEIKCEENDKCLNKIIREAWEFEESSSHEEDSFPRDRLTVEVLIQDVSRKWTFFSLLSSFLMNLLSWFLSPIWTLLCVILGGVFLKFCSLVLFVAV